jgi:hypothetical protein
VVIEYERKMDEVKTSLPQAVCELFTKQWGDFIDRCSKSGEHIEDLDKYFDQYLSTFLKYPHQIVMDDQMKTEFQCQ